VKGETSHPQMTQMTRGEAARFDCAHRKRADLHHLVNLRTGVQGCIL